MSSAPRAGKEERVLILAPAGRDAALADRALRQAEVRAEICENMSELCARVQAGAGAALITNEALAESGATSLHQAVAQAPAWSDLPLIILTTADMRPEVVFRDDEILSQLGNVTFLERPLRPQTLLTAVNSALRARRRQYQVRDLLVRQEKAVQRLDLLAEVASHLLLSDKPEEVVASVFRKIAAHLGLELYVCYVLDEASQCLRLTGHFGVPASFVESRKWLSLEESFCGSVATKRTRTIAEGVQYSNDAIFADIKSLGITAYACFPLLANGNLLGTLSFGIRGRDHFDHEELAMMETICNQVAVAIERKRTEEALHDFNQLLEKRVEERTSQLQETHEQMEAFTYSISHDLRAPLRAIRGFAQALAEDYTSVIDVTGRDYLERMAAGAERMDHLIQDLLQYSRLGRSTLTFAPIRLDESVQRALQQLERDIRTSEATVEVEGPLPEILGHAVTLEQVLTNLVSNALKFVASGVKPHVRIWATQEEDRIRLWVADNGIGIAAAFHQRIFGVFERLHGTDVYPGTGIGLAIVAKGVARMGGKVGVESNAGEGSRFWIELPRPLESGPLENQVRSVRP